MIFYAFILVLAGKIAQKIGLTAVSSTVLACAGTIIPALYALLVQENSAFEHASVLRENRFFLESLGLTTAYAKETIRLYLEKLIADKEAVLNHLRGCGVSYDICVLWAGWVHDRLGGVALEPALPERDGGFYPGDGRMVREGVGREAAAVPAGQRERCV
jgi:hypothetical protein